MSDMEPPFRYEDVPRLSKSIVDFANVDSREYLKGRTSLDSEWLWAHEEARIRIIVEKMRLLTPAKAVRFGNDMGFVPLGFEGATDPEPQIAARNRARAAKDWKLADEIRNGIHRNAIRIEEYADGTLWVYCAINRPKYIPFEGELTEEPQWAAFEAKMDKIRADAKKRQTSKNAKAPKRTHPLGGHITGAPVV